MKQSDIYKLHQNQAHGKYKKEMLEIVWTHSLIVKSISLQIADSLEKKYGIKTDKKLIEIGALIHDIGTYNCYDDEYVKCVDYFLHGGMGYEILIKEGVSKKRARFALTHVGTGIGSDIPISIEEEIVAYADNFHSKGCPRFNSFEEIIIKLTKVDPNSEIILKRFKYKFGIPDLKDLIKKYKKWHERINELMKMIK